MDKIGVAVVTFNRLKYLQICLQKISNQTYKNFDVLVVNNNSDDGTKEFLLTQDLAQIHLDDNTGPAGGFHEAIKYFLEKQDYDYLWLMDDDVFPAADCLEHLLGAREEHSIFYPYIRTKDLKSITYPGWSGFLLPIGITRQAGLPIKELFYWSEDTEYIQHRIRDQLGCKIKFVPKAKVVHFTTKSRKKRAWGYYYEVRNMLYMRLYVKERTALRAFKLVRSWVKLLGAIILREDNKLEKIKWFLRGTVHGITKKLGKTIDPHAGKGKNIAYHKVAG
ncbi:glycosyltransferase [Pontibacter diazotrophicus]|uniref:Glycosyltransferase n=1 Tax=Pontibacter diazotrophicus TaxID=1400979 RepID=A0A3D8LFD6_9BACT|nr:glycosyltransferase [Pontibacter diazotrophicus]RDV16135.1 glycosyltransferase [Pontibacter diazotrophicus]